MAKDTPVATATAEPTTPEEFKAALEAQERMFQTQFKTVSDGNVELISKNAELQKRNIELLNANTNLTNQLSESETLIAELQDELANKEINTLTPNTTPTLKHKGKTYEVHARKFKFEGNSYVISDLQDKELVGRLIEKNAGFLVPVK